MTARLVLLQALTDAIARLSAAVAALAAEDYDVAEAELLAGQQVIGDTVRDLRGAA